MNIELGSAVSVTFELMSANSNARHLSDRCANLLGSNIDSSLDRTARWRFEISALLRSVCSCCCDIVLCSQPYSGHHWGEELQKTLVCI